MATLYKCDKCNKVIKNNKILKASFSGGLPWQNFEFCIKCSDKIIKDLKKIFPKLINE